ncbi:hypothetical protein VTK56DRAFT_7939 [Thermocarpiscus australiensis]
MPQLRCPNPPATARLFIQLSMRNRPVERGLPILDLLLPLPARSMGPLSVRAHRAVSSAATSSARTSRSWRGALSDSPLPRTRTTPLSPATRAFSASPTWRATRAIFNPQVDDDGKEMTLEITPRAAKRLSEIMAKDANPHLALRIQVESGGCHGFQYLMKLVTLPPSLPTTSSSTDATTTTGQEEKETEIREDDTIFAYAADDDSPSSAAAADLTAPKIILDLPSLELLKGSKVDFTMELIGSQFKIVDNPLATSSCGCGTSFDIKI